MSEIKTYLADRPQIDQIKLGGTLYDINVQKDWTENNVNKVGYVNNRTHYFYQATGTELYKADSTTDYSISHTFKNRYTQNGNAVHTLYTDLWFPDVSWIENNNYYTVEILPTGSSSTAKVYAEQKLQAIFCTEYDAVSEASLKDTSHWELHYDSSANCFWVSGEDVAQDATGFILTNGFTVTIKPCNKSEFTYTLTKQLDARFLPLDTDNIRIDNNGKLTVDNSFSNDFTVSYQFGQYSPQHEVSAKDKNIKDVILDAFCRDVEPIRNEAPKIKSFEIIPVTEADANGFYEVGQEVNFDWKTQFDPGKYEFSVMADAKNVASDATSDVVITGHSCTITKSETENESFAEYDGSGDTELFENSTGNVNVYNAIGWGTSDDGRLATAAGNYTVTMPSKPVLEPMDATFTVGFNHIDVKQGDTSYPHRPSTMFTVPIDSSKLSTICFNGDRVTLTAKECEYKIPTFKCDYRWFWGAIDNGHTADWLADVFSTLPETPMTIARTDLRAQNSQLGSFPDSFKTFQMRKLYFLAPKGQVSKLDIQAADGSNPDIQSTYSVKVADPSGVAHEYDLWVFKNATPDLAAHTYKINYEKGAN
jgi:hypothetical protein